MAEPVDRLAGLMRDVAAAQRTTLARQDILAQVRKRPPLPRSRLGRIATRLPRLRFAIPMLAAAGAIALWIGQSGLGLIQPPLSFSVGEDRGVAPVSGRVGDRFEAARDRSLPLSFSDGSRVVLKGGARVRVADLDGHGATLDLEKGHAEIEVHHRRGTHWRLHAGTFEVTVTGTRFSIDWEEAGQALTVVMSEGAVEVGGPGVGGGAPVVVRAGQRFQATSGQPRWTLATTNAASASPPGESTIDEPTAPAPPEAPAGTAVSAGPAPTPSGGAATTAGGQRTWQALARAGRYQEALKMVERAGFERLCRRLGAADLIQLGDAARLARNPTRAEAAYGAARRRFPGSDRPAFALGLVAFEQRHDFKAAAHWFGTYGRQYPNGPLALEAVGREMESWHRAGDNTRARRAARAYLDQAPAGPYAPLARQISAP